MRPFIRTIETLELDGGALCLDFVNSVQSRFEHPRLDFLATAGDWLIWLRRTQLCGKAEETILHQYILKNWEKAGKELVKIVWTRELLYRIFRALARKEKPSDEDLRRFNKVLSRAFSHMELTMDNTTTVSRIWNHEPAGLVWTLYPVIYSAYELLVPGEMDRIKECPNCGWLFIDRTRNNRRTWCNMKTCGNTVKGKKYYEKKKTLMKTS